jgi:hypothetical protein
LKKRLKKTSNKPYETAAAVISAPRPFTLESSAVRLPPQKSFTEPSLTVQASHVKLLNLSTSWRTGYREKAPCSITNFACDLPKTALSVSSPSVKRSVEVIKILLEQMKVVTLRIVGCYLARTHATGSSLVVIPMIKKIILKEVVITQFINKRDSFLYH